MLKFCASACTQNSWLRYMWENKILLKWSAPCRCLLKLLFQTLHLVWPYICRLPDYSYVFHCICRISLLYPIICLYSYVLHPWYFILDQWNVFYQVSVGRILTCYSHIFNRKSVLRTSREQAYLSVRCTSYCSLGKLVYSAFVKLSLIGVLFCG
jgi:hypothetical protein